MGKRFWVGGIAFILMLTLFGQLSYAATVTVETKLGYGGYAIPGRWIPVWLRVNGASDSVWLEVSREGATGARQVVERFSCKNEGLIEYPILADYQNTTLRIRLVNGSVVLSEQTVTVFKKVFPGHLVLINNLPSTAQVGIGAALNPTEPVLAQSVSLTELPHHILSYDGISAVVMSDPGPVLNPAQLKALRSWLVGGGRLVLFATRAGAESLVSEFGEFLPRRQDQDSNSGFAVGLGAVRLSAQPYTEAEWRQPESWRRLLALAPYAQSRRLTPSRFFGDDQPVAISAHSSANSPNLPVPVLVWLAAWCLGALIIGFVAKRRAIAYVFAYTVVAGLAVLLMGNSLTTEWRRGATVHARAVLLPFTETAVVNAIAQMNFDTQLTVPLRQASPWGLTLAAGTAETGTMIPNAKLTQWNHHLNQAVWVVKDGEAQIIELIGLAAIGANPRAVWLTAPNRQLYQVVLPGQLKQPLVIIDRQNHVWKLHDVNSGSWRAVQELPGWLRSEQGWIRNLQRTNPALDWVFGYGNLSGMQLAVQGAPVREVVWALPLLKGALR